MEAGLFFTALLFVIIYKSIRYVQKVDHGKKSNEKQQVREIITETAPGGAACTAVFAYTPGRSILMPSTSYALGFLADDPSSLWVVPVAFYDTAVKGAPFLLDEQNIITVTWDGDNGLFTVVASDRAEPWQVLVRANNIEEWGKQTTQCRANIQQQKEVAAFRRFAGRFCSLYGKGPAPEPQWPEVETEVDLKEYGKHEEYEFYQFYEESGEQQKQGDTGNRGNKKRKRRKARR